MATGRNSCPTNTVRIWFAQNKQQIPDRSCICHEQRRFADLLVNRPAADVIMGSLFDPASGVAAAERGGPNGQDACVSERTAARPLYNPEGWTRYLANSGRRGALPSRWSERIP